jgi:hypothetical protein
LSRIEDHLGEQWGVGMGKIGAFAEDLWFAECPRWHDNALYMSDMWDHTVYRFEADGTRSVIIRFPDER